MGFWCQKCAIPVFGSETCPLCGSNGITTSFSSICNPVFRQEKKLMSYILKEDVLEKNIWYLGGGNYLIDGKRTKLPFVNFYKNHAHLQCAETLRNNIDVGDEIMNHSAFLAANERYIKQKIFEAEEYVVDVMRNCNEYDKNEYVPTVSFSGGKDSIVVSRIVRDALQDESVIHYFGDTTLEFPATYHYVQETFRRENPIPPMIPSETESDFFKLCNVFGPPSRFERWCCTIFKTSNLNTELQWLEGNSLTFLGIRHSESNERKSYERTQRKSKIGSQINAMPIIEWTDYDVWLYILYKKLAFNDAYRYGYKRVGCWCCPYNSDWAMMLTDIYYPELADKLKTVLYDFARKTKKTDIKDYVENGKWKLRSGASGLKIRNVNIVDTPCNLSDRARNIITTKKIHKRILEYFTPFGKLDVFEKEEATYITVTEQKIDDNGEKYDYRKLCDLVITFGTTIIKVLPALGTDPLLLVNRIKCQIRKYQFCFRCTACDSICPYGAIDTMRGEYVVDALKCKQNLSVCSKCIAKFYNGCITCEVLAGKKNVVVDNQDV